MVKLLLKHWHVFIQKILNLARRGGELGYMGRGMLDPTFAAAAFNLTDPKKLSKIIESEFGYHIIQLVDRRGDK